MVNYENGKIYKITSEKSGLTYYGSTSEYYLSQRLGKHIGQYKQYLNDKKKYVTSFELLKCEDYKIELIKNFPCANKTQLTTEEGKYIRENECVNKVIPGRTLKEYYENNKEYYQGEQKEYRENNKNKIKEKNKEWREDNKEHIKDYREKNKEKIKELRDANKDKTKERSRRFYEQNKEKIKERNSKPYECSCGSIVIWGDKSKHFKTKKHCEYINNL